MATGKFRGRNVRSRCRCSKQYAVHINSHSWLRSSSTHEPSDPPLKVVQNLRHPVTQMGENKVHSPARDKAPPGDRTCSPVQDQVHAVQQPEQASPSKLLQQCKKRKIATKTGAEAKPWLRTPH